MATRRPIEGIRCGTCRFFRNGRPNMGHCHRFPQGLQKEPQDWCGEWRRKWMED